MADAAMVRRVVSIVESDPHRRFIVPSAPGRRTPDDKKITDLLLAWHTALKNDLDPGHPVDTITQRFTELAAELDVSVDINAEIAKIAAEAPAFDSPDYLASRGEYLAARILADRLGATFIEPAQ
jgi:aspartate kinase